MWPIDLERHFRTLSWEAAFLQRSPIYLLSKSVLILHVQFCLIASLTARVHWKVRCLSKVRGLCKTIVLIMNPVKICIIYHLRKARFDEDDRGGN